MATYTSAEMHNSGTLGEELSGAKTFTLLNVTASNNNFPIGYLTLEGNSTANQNLTSTTQLENASGQNQAWLLTTRIDDRRRRSSHSSAPPPRVLFSASRERKGALRLPTYYVVLT